jgi:hypothetical protein
MQEPTQIIVPLPHINEKEILIKATGAVIGNSRKMPLHRIVYVVPEKYAQLSEKNRYSIANVIGGLTHTNGSEQKRIMLIGPGRWGTSTPSLGIPVMFSEINRASVLCEIDSMHEGLIPDLSLGTHFFNEMVEMNMLYIAYFVGRGGNIFNQELFTKMPNALSRLLPDAAQWEDTILVLDQEDLSKNLYLYANSLEQSVIVYRKE